MPVVCIAPAAMTSALAGAPADDFANGLLVRSEQKTADQRSLDDGETYRTVGKIALTPNNVKHQDCPCFSALRPAWPRLVYESINLARPAGKARDLAPRISRALRA